MKDTEKEEIKQLIKEFVSSKSPSKATKSPKVARKGGGKTAAAGAGGGGETGKLALTDARGSPSKKPAGLGEGRC